VPAKFSVSNRSHGVDVTSIGLSFTAPGEKLTVRTITKKGWPLYFAPSVPGPLTLVRSQATAITAPKGRLFLIGAPSWDADYENIDLQLAWVDASGAKSTRTQPKVLTDTMSFLGGNQYKLDALNKGGRYRVTNGSAKTSVLVVAEAPPDVKRNYAVAEPVLTIAGPPRQALLPPGGALEVRGVIALHFLVPNWPGAPEESAEISVTGGGADVRVEKGSSEAREMDRRLKSP
jgi:hypothetical protein